MDKFFNQEETQRMGKFLLVLVAVVALYFAMKFVNEVKAFNTIGMAPSAVNTIDVTGEGIAYAVPNVATETFTIQDQEATVAAAQNTVNTKVAAALSFLKGAGIADKDITTTDYAAYPQYSDPCAGLKLCPTNIQAEGQVISGYTVSQSVSVKIRDTTQTGKIVDGLGAAGATGLNGPTYTVDDPTAVQDQARTKAISDAETKAKALASELGVRLVRIAHYSESTSGDGSTPSPMYAKAADAMAPTTQAQLPGGENKYTSDVTVTYEIR